MIIKGKEIKITMKIKQEKKIILKIIKIDQT